jgi:hypothetical protein
MPDQSEHEKPENLVEAPGEAEQAARTLQDAVDSHQSLEGYYAMNNVRNPEQLEQEAEADREKAEQREKGHPIP